MVASAGNRCARPRLRTRAMETTVLGGPPLAAHCRLTVKYPAAYYWVMAVGATSTLTIKSTNYSLLDRRWMWWPPAVSRRPVVRQSRILSTNIGGRLWVGKRDQSSGRSCHRGRRAGLAAPTGALL